MSLPAQILITYALARAMLFTARGMVEVWRVWKRHRLGRVKVIGYRITHRHSAT